MPVKRLPNEFWARLVFATFSLRSGCAQAEIRNVHMSKVERVGYGFGFGFWVRDRDKIGGQAKKGLSSVGGTLKFRTNFVSGQMATTQQVLNSSRCPWLTDAHYSEFNKQFTLNVLRLMAFSAPWSRSILAATPKNKATLFGPHTWKLMWQASYKFSYFPWESGAAKWELGTGNRAVCQMYFINLWGTFGALWGKLITVRDGC